MEQRFEETSKQDNPHLLRVGALKIYCERKQTAKAVFFLRSSVSKNSVLQFNYFFSCTLTVFGVIIIYIAL